MLALFLAVTASAQTAGNNPAQVLEVRKIWDAGAHNAFTDLIRWKNVWWCTFREAEHHVGEGGKIRAFRMYLDTLYAAQAVQWLVDAHQPVPGEERP